MKWSGIKNSKYLSTIFIIISLAITCGGLFVSQCLYPFYCERYYHRYDDGTCPQDASGCTHCINGSVIDPESLTTCLELNVTRKPAQETRVTLGEVVIIPCLVSTKIECLWKKDGRVIDFAGHPRFQLKIQTEAYTTDCSLVIQNASSEDEGLWTCTNRPIDHEFNSNYTIAEHTRVYVEQPAVVVVEQPGPVLSVWIFVGVAVGVVLLLVIAFVGYKCYKRQSPHVSVRKMSTGVINNLRFTRMLSSPALEVPENLISNDKKCAEKKLSII